MAKRDFLTGDLIQEPEIRRQIRALVRAGLAGVEAEFRVLRERLDALEDENDELAAMAILAAAHARGTEDVHDDDIH